MGRATCIVTLGSSDIYFFEIACMIGMDRIARSAERSGLGQQFSLELSTQEKELLPTPDRKRATYSSGWYTGETLPAGIGQAYVHTTPLQLAVMTARLAIGRKVNPTLAYEIGNEPTDKFSRLDVNAK